MQIDFQGRIREVDASQVTITQAFVIKDATKDENYPAGRSLLAWQNGLNEVEPLCVRGLYWLMLQQEGTKVPILALDDFPVLEFSNAVVKATIAEAKAAREAAAAEEREQAEREAALAAIPTGAPSQEQNSRAATTRTPRAPAAAKANG
jgi:hypothetical protein